MKKTCAMMFAASCAFLLQSCKIMYTPNMENVPLFKEKNEIRATLTFNNYQAAYAVTDNIGIMVNGQFKSTEWKITSGPIEEKYKNRLTLIEGGLGYFKPLGTSSVFEVYGGGGIGSASYNSSNSDASVGSSTKYDNYSAKTSRFFIQPSIGLTKEHIDLAFSARMVGVKFSAIDISGYLQRDLVEDQLNDLDKPLFMFFEPAITFRGGWENVKFHVQVINSLKMNPEAINRVSLIFNTGVHINFAPRQKK